MINRKRVGLFLLCSLLFTITMLSTGRNTAKASEVPLPSQYFFVFNGINHTSGTEYEMKTPEVLTNISAGSTWSPTTTVTWVSSEPNVVKLQPSSSGSNFIRMIRQSPGYSTITAVITYGTNTYTLSCLVKVALTFDIQKTGLKLATTTNERILVINEVDATKQIYLKYVDYSTGTPENPVPVSGAAILANAVLFESDNEGVATVDATGLVTAKGAGSALITVTSNTMSTQDRPMKDTLRVVVAPSFTLTYDVGSTHVEVDSSNDPRTAQPVLNVPSSFVLESTATRANNLKWEVYDTSTGKKLSPTSAKMTYSVSEVSGNVSFHSVKAGTYEVYAFANDKYNASTEAPFAYMKLVVPITLRDVNLVMQVGDTYSIGDNSNIPDPDMFSYTYVEGNELIAQVDGDGVIKALRKGHVYLRLRYLSANDLYDDQLILDGDVQRDFYIDINVIDGIALNITNAYLYTSGTLMLQALVTDPSSELIWTSSHPTIATVNGGLVTGLKVGTTTITVSQNIGGVIKSATCRITVQQSVASITINPANIILPIGNYRTLQATITPKALSGVTLQWKSSNPNIVAITESSALSATIQGIAGGHAVISAINQDNVVVGYCHVSVQQSVTSIVLSETEVTVDLKTKRMQLRASVYPENALNKKVNWSTTDASKARVDENGMVTFVKAGTVSIIATSDDNPSARAICNITIQIPVASIALDEKEKTMYVGEAARLSYVILPTTASINSVTWTSTDNKVVSVDSSGKVTAKGVGTAVIILKSMDGGYTAYCTITVKKIATGVKLDVSKLDMKSGDYYYLKADLTPKDSTDTVLVWESSDTKVATVNEEGRVVARDSGQAIIMVRTEAGGIAYCKVTVTQPVEGLIINFSEKTIYVGDKLELKVSVSPSEASKREVIWKSSNTEVATVTEDGEVKGIAGGTALITCTTVEGGYTATCVLTVRELVSTIKLNHENYRIGLDKTFILEAIVSTQNATNKNVTWKSSNPKVASVNNKGKVTGLAYGFATITATAQDGSEVEAACEVEVVRPVTRVSLNKSFMNMLVGDGMELKATLEPKNATYGKVSWSSSNDKVAMVDDDGFVTAIGQGEAIITATAQDDSGKKATCYVTVSNRVPATGITLANRSLVMVPGEDKLVQTVISPVNSTDALSWSTDNVAVAKVDSKTGKITAVSIGTANVTVMTASGKTAIIEITVIGLNVTKLELEQYSTYTLYVEGANSRVTWDVANPEVAVVTNGRIVSRAIGTTTITAQVNGRKLECKLSVVKIR